jgi:GTPase SAR1 family protein
MTIKIGIVGVPGSGKTTLARALASKCRSIDRLKNVELVSEYARRYISKHGSISSMSEQYRILEKQAEWRLDHHLPTFVALQNLDWTKEQYEKSILKVEGGYMRIKIESEKRKSLKDMLKE